MPQKITKNIEAAIKAGDIQTIENYLYENNNSPLLANKINDAIDDAGNTLLHYAAFYNQDKIISYLLGKHADINSHTSGKYALKDTPLHMAARTNSTTAMALLLDNGAAIEARTSNGYTPLHKAISWGNAEAVKLLLDRNANVNARTFRDAGNYKYPYTPLHLVCNSGLSPEKRIKIASMLLENKNINLDVSVVFDMPTPPMSLSNYALLRGATDVAEMIDERNRLEKLQQNNAQKRIAELEERVRHLERKVHKLKAEKVTPEKTADTNTLFSLKK